MTPPDISSTVLTWIGLALGALVLVFRTVTSSLDEWGKFLEKRRAIKQQAEDARIVDLTDQLGHLAARVDELEERDQAQLQLLTAHAAWDYTVMEALQRVGMAVPAPPPLRIPLQQRTDAP